MSKTISKDIPLAEITLRRYEKPYNLQKRELIRKLCLSIGLLQPGDSRDIIVEKTEIAFKRDCAFKRKKAGKKIKRIIFD